MTAAARTETARFVLHEARMLSFRIDVDVDAGELLDIAPPPGLESASYLSFVDALITNREAVVEIITEEITTLLTEGSAP
jgi:hypothetical protein